MTVKLALEYEKSIAASSG